MGKSLVIVESPTKARTIEKFLGKDFEVKASFGHVRDLPNNAAEIPAEVKKEAWSRLGINVDKNFEPLYIIPPEKSNHVKDLKKSVKEATELYLATDEDREGESISWHLLEVLQPKIPVKRLVFHEITREAIAECLQNPRSVDENLVRAQETRRIVDRLYGYSVSPLLWKKVAPRLSAGRVQSVAMRLLVERERERMRFKEAAYWDLKAEVTTAKSVAFESDLNTLDGKRIALGKDFDPHTGQLPADATVLHLKGPDALSLSEKLRGKTGKVLSIEEKPYTTRPSPPFTTSTLQQEASRKLGFAARRTMQVAQKLYENGLITYMRTDSTSLSNEALQAARNLISTDFGREYVPDEPRLYKTKVKNAQEAHEAIRPAGSNFESPAVVRQKFGDEGFKLYDLIWKRTIASQMKDSSGMRTAVDIGCENCVFRSNGSTIEFPGFLRAYVEGSDDPEAELADRERILPKLSVGEELKFTKVEPLEHKTQPPARFTEGSLIKELERLGIGRPSTWATIVDVVLSRSYAFKRGQALVPTFLAHALTNLMEIYFSEMVDYDYTARFEDDLDSISRGEADNQKYLSEFYFGNGHRGLKNLVKDGESSIDPRIVCGIPIGTDAEARNVEVRIGRWGPFLTNGTDRAGLPDDLAPDELTLEKSVELLAEAAKGPQSLGVDPETQKPVYLKKGRFGPYIQLGDQEEGGDKPKMVSLLPGMAMTEVNFEIAQKLLTLPRNLGILPATGKEVTATLGRYGPYLRSDNDSRTIPEGTSVLEITLEQAIELFNQPRTRGRGVRAAALKELGTDEASGAKITIKSGRYGPYVTDGTTNASLPKDSDPQTVTIEQAMELIKQREAMGPSKKRGRGAPKAKAAPKETKEKKAKAPAKKKKKKKGAEEEEGASPAE